VSRCSYGVVLTPLRLVLDLHDLDLPDPDLAARVVLLEGEIALHVGVVAVDELVEGIAVDLERDVVADGGDLIVAARRALLALGDRRRLPT